jgi:hypothetical protein
MRSPIRWSAKMNGPTETRHRGGARVLSAIVLLFSILSLLVTPGQVSAQTVLSPPVFSVQRGFQTSAFNLTLSLPAGTTGTIYYTLNGNSPVNFVGSGAAPGATAYSGAFNISTTTVVRAAVVNGTSKSAVATHTYLFLNAVRSQPSTPKPGWPNIFSNPEQVTNPADPLGPKLTNTYPADYEMDPEITGQYSAQQLDTALKSLPSVSIVTDLPNLWDPAIGLIFNSSAKGSDPETPDPFNNPVKQADWERPTSIEWINPDGTPGFAIDGGLRVHGQASRRPNRTPKKSFRVYFRKGYGVGNLEFQLFNDATAVSKFDRLIFRNGGNRQWPYFDRDQRREADYVNDEWARQAWQEMGHLAPHGTYVHLYLNGMYWGLYNVAERIDEKYLAAYLNLPETEIDLIESEEEQDDNSVASAGTIDAYNELLGLIQPGSSTPINDAQYNVIKTKVDVNSLADYFIHVHYIGKTDWPDHNYNLYRARIGADTRFKFIAWDNDSGFNKVTQNTTLMTETLTHPFIWDPTEGIMVPDTTQPLMLDAPLQIFNRLTTNAEFRQVLTDRFYKHVQDPTGVLAPASCDAMYRELTGIVDQAVIGESARWGDYSRDVYPSTNVADKPFPAYLHSRDLPNSYTDPANAVTEENQKNWLRVVSEKLNTYCPNRGAILKSQYDINGWLVNGVQPPAISQRGGIVPVAPGNVVTLNNTPNNGAGDIYYTTNGVDPRAEFGTVAPDVQPSGDSATITISRATTVKARVRNGNSWSPLLEYVFAPTQDMAKLLINEVHYSPGVNVGQDAKLYEFVELYNSGNTPLQLDGVSFSRGISYTFPANTNIGPGEYRVLVANQGIFQGRYPGIFVPGQDGVFTGSLANEGEPLELVDAIGEPFKRVDYKILAPWPALAPGNDKSLSLKDPATDSALPASWSWSTQIHGTPRAPNGFVDPGVLVPSILWTTPATLTYGQPLTASQLNAAMAAILINGTPVVPAGTISYSPPLGTVLDAGYDQPLSVTFTPDDPEQYTSATNTVLIDVVKAPLTVTADSKVWQKGTPFPTLTATYSGMVNGDTAAELDSPPVLSTTATESSPEATYPISATNGIDNNYTMFYVDGTFTVTTKSIPVLSWASPAGITYGMPLTAAQLNATVGGGIAGTFEYDPPLGTVLPAGNGQILSVTFTPTDGNTYAQVITSVTLDIAKAPLTIKAANKVKLLGTDNPPLTANYSGFVNAETSTSLDTPVVLSTAATKDSPLGTYPIIASGASDANYAITFVNGTLTVTDDTRFNKVMLPLLAR